MADDTDFLKRQAEIEKHREEIAALRARIKKLVTLRTSSTLPDTSPDPQHPDKPRHGSENSRPSHSPNDT